jgi:tRNA(Ile)-lysidine synthetase-like protein
MSITYIKSIGKVYDFWFDPKNSQIHFNSTKEDDKLITELFQELHTNLNNLSFDDLTKLKCKDSISYIILYDQITRHIYRNNQDIISYYLNKIIAFVRYFYNKNKDILNIDEFCFTLLPLRHTNNSEDTFFVINETWKRIKLGDNLNRFITATYTRYIKFNDDTDNLEYYQYNKDNTIKKLPDKLTRILPDSCILGNIITKSKYDLINCDYLDKSKKYIISLSGGVDSMVTSYIMKNLGFKIVGVHISYMNRDVCELEIDMIKQWCDIIEIDLYYRKINEIQRAPCMEFGLRDIYETYTRDIRFNAYRNTAKILKQEIPQVLLGHNNDDAFENILTNISSLSHINNLTGMEKQLIISNINFIRPMLDTPKKNIYKFAQDHFIPYLPTSTPEWSQRGKIRDKVRPALEEWNPIMVNSMFKLSAKITSMSKLVDMFVKKTYDDIKLNKYLQININDLNLEEYYWDKLFKMLGFNISLKSLNNFIEKLVFINFNTDRFKNDEITKLNLNKDIQIKFKKITDNVYYLYF